MSANASQVRHPWRATLRTIFQALIGFAVILPLVVEASGLDPTSVPGLVVALAVAAGLTRVMALPQVETFLARFVPFLAADPTRTTTATIPHRDQRGAFDPGMVAAVTLGVVAAWVVIQLLQRLIQ